MSKGDWRRPCVIPEEEVAKNYAKVFGPPKLNVMSDKERAELLAEQDRLDKQDRLDSFVIEYM